MSSERPKDSGTGLIISAIASIIIGIGAAIYYVEVIHSKSPASSHSALPASLRARENSAEEAENLEAEDLAAAVATSSDTERLKVEEILGLAASRERMKWRVKELSETERLEAGRELAELAGGDPNTPIEVLLDQLWDRWEGVANKEAPE